MLRTNVGSAVVAPTIRMDKTGFSAGVELEEVDGWAQREEKRERQPKAVAIITVKGALILTSV